MRRFDEAIAEFREGIRLQPEDFFYHFGLLQSLRSAGRSERVHPDLSRRRSASSLTTP